MFVRTMNLYAIGPSANELVMIVYVIRLLFGASIRLDNDVLVHEFLDPINVLRELLVLSEFIIRFLPFGFGEIDQKQKKKFE